MRYVGEARRRPEPQGPGRRPPRAGKEEWHGTDGGGQDGGIDPDWGIVVALLLLPLVPIVEAIVARCA